MSTLLVHLRNPELGSDDRPSTLRVLLRDTSLADATHPTIAESVTSIQPGAVEADVALDVPGPGLDRRRRYSLWAHVDRSGHGDLVSGDLVTTVNVPVTADDILVGRRVEAPLTRI